MLFNYDAGRMKNQELNGAFENFPQVSYNFKKGGHMKQDLGVIFLLALVLAVFGFIVGVYYRFLP